MMKYLILIALALVAWWFWRQANRTPQVDKPASAPPETMARCAYCDVYCPRGDMVTDTDGRLYCTPAHRDKHYKENSEHSDGNTPQ